MATPLFSPLAPMFNSQTLPGGSTPSNLPVVQKKPAVPVMPAPNSLTPVPPALAVPGTTQMAGGSSTPSSVPATPQTGSSGMHTIASGDTLSGVAAKNGISLAQLLDINPQYKANPNLIRPGQTVKLTGGTSNPAGNFNRPATPAPTPAPAGTVTSPSGVQVNPATGGVVQTPAVPNVPAPTPTPTPDPNNSLFTSPEYEAAAADYEKNIAPTADEVAIQEEQNRLGESFRTAYQGESERAIPLGFITGRQKAIEDRSLNLATTLKDRAALMQAKRTSALEASKFRLETEASKLGAKREANKPVEVAPGSSLINPLTGKTMASGISLADKNALDTFYNLTQTYPDARVTWNDKLTPQQNLANAQKAAQQSPSFNAKNTVYAINPLTGQPTIISKMGGYTGGGDGGGAFGGGSGTQAPQDGTQLSVDNLAPELRGSLSNISGVQFFDQSKVTPAQLPYLQRASQEMGIPMISKEDANKIQNSAAQYNSASAIISKVKELAEKVITAPNNAGAQTIQMARLKAIELAPSLSTDNDAKQFIAQRKAVLTQLSKATGQVGVLTDQDLAIIGEAMPAYGDSQELARQKAANLDSVIESVLNGAIEAYIGSSGGGGKTGGQDDPLGLGFNQPLSNGKKGSAQQIASAIKQVESSGNYNAKGGSGEFGAYQFMPETWKDWAKTYLGNASAPMTPANQDKVANAKINDLLKQGYTAEEIALIWNGGQPIVKKGVNKSGVKYDSGAYSKKVLSVLG